MDQKTVSLDITIPVTNMVNQLLETTLEIQKVEDANVKENLNKDVRSQVQDLKGFLNQVLNSQHQSDVEIVMSQAHVSEARAKEALTKNNNNIVDAILDLV